MSLTKSLVSIADCSKEEYLKILDLAGEFEKNPNQNILNGKVVASLFFEPSTRTRLSFESAVVRLGGKVIGFSDAGSSSSSKGETFSDTIRMASNYCDLMVIRHPLEGTARLASEISPVPVINAGDGANQHPTQTLLDMYSIIKTQGRLENLTICLVGDLKYGRTVHSLIMAMSYFNPNFIFVSPDELQLPYTYKLFLKQHSINYTETTHFESEIVKSDIVYMTRVQRERFSDPMEYEKTKNAYILKANMLHDTKPNMKILHPLPRINEISTDVDNTKNAYYFQQALNGVYTRQAIISHVLGLR